MEKLKVLDLFSGMGGFSYGFARNGFKITGADIKGEAELSYKKLTNGDFIRSDLRSELISDSEYDIIIGGPPCRPWSSINTNKRGSKHPDYTLISRFLEHIRYHKPKLFVMENVLPLAKDPTLIKLISSTIAMGYSVDKLRVTYSDFGASVKRTRLIILGLLGTNIGTLLGEITSALEKPKTVRDAIFYLKDKEYGSVPDHVWSNLKTIEKYKNYYKTGKYGWRILKWDESAPSFGNIMKTYTLHPDSSFDTGNLRAISVAEAARIMGFPKFFHFPENISIGKRYQMIVDSVSPVFSNVLAHSVESVLTGNVNYVSTTE